MPRPKSNPQAVLRPQDLVVLLRLALERGPARTYAVLAIVAERLGDDLCDRMVFVGGAVVGLLITDPAMPTIRPTEDLDLICRAVALGECHRVETALRVRGFVQDMRPDAPIRRWQARLASALVDEVAA